MFVLFVDSCDLYEKRTKFLLYHKTARILTTKKRKKRMNESINTSFL